MLIEALVKQAGIDQASLEWLALTASKRYKTYEIPKKTGGTRTIHHPSKSLKAVQRWISKFLLRRLPVHVAAQAYVQGSSIRKNANFHAASNFTLRVDFADFFPSFSQGHVETFLASAETENLFGLTDKDIAFVSKIVSRNGYLTIGAPSSPMLTNSMMFSFDENVSRYATQRDLIYTRYADDLFFSSHKPDNLSGVVEAVNNSAQNHRYANLKLNPDKTVFLSKRYTRRVTGLVLTTDGKVSIGRDRKRIVKSQIHKHLSGELELSLLPKLCGYLAFINDAEPEFLKSLIRKYGEQVIGNLLNQHNINETPLD